MNTLIKNFNTKIKEAKDSYFGILSFAVVAQSCMSSIAAAYVLSTNAHISQLIICATLGMGTNAIGLAQAPLKLLVWSSIISVIVNAFLIGIHV